jgi:hypothetical protein
MKPTITPSEYRAVLRQDLCAFIERCLYELNPNTQFLWNWHIEEIAAVLEACRRGEITRLIVNVPPRSLKSVAANAFVAFLLGHDPSAKIGCVSYGQDLANARIGLSQDHHKRFLQGSLPSYTTITASTVRARVHDHPARVPPLEIRGRCTYRQGSRLSRRRRSAKSR